MQFIRLSTLRQLFPDQQFPVPPAEADRFRTLFYASELAQQQSIPENEQLLLHLQSDTFTLYMDWTEQERQLTHLLEGTTQPEAFANATNSLNHALFAGFRKFLTPFLAPKLMQWMQSPGSEDHRKGMTYICLLEDREADLVQHEVFIHMQRRIAEAEKKVANARKEDELLAIYRDYFTPTLLQTVNLFSQSYYQVKTAWLSLFRTITHHRASTRRLVIHMITDLRKLNLNKDHLEELIDLERSIKIGAVKVEEDAVPVKRILLITLATVLVVALIAVVWWLPTEPVYDKEQEQTAFMDFTPKERATMDSLLRNVQVQQERPDNRIDASDMDYVGEELIVNIPWNNQSAEYLISEWRAHEKDSAVTRPETANSQRDTRVFPTTESLRDKKGSISVKFQNDTELSVFILVFRDRADEWVYSQYVEKNAITGFKLNPGEQLLVLPGSKPPRHLRAEEVPFEQVDSRFYKALREPFVVDHTSPSKVKLVWKQINNHDFYLLDLNHALNK